MSGSHISEDFIDRYAMGVLDGDAVARVEEHVLDCPICQARLKEADQFLAIFREAAIQPDARPVPAWGWVRHFRLHWAAAAGAILLAIAMAPKRGDTGADLVAVEMQSLRGPEAAVHIASGKQGLLKFDVTPQAAIADYQVQIVDTAGAEVLTSSAMLSAGRLAARIGKLPRGSYWVRIYLRRPARELIAEYGLTAV